MADDLIPGANNNTGAAGDDGEAAPVKPEASTILGADPGGQDQTPPDGTATPPDKPAGEPDKPAGAPEEYADFTLPDGIEFDKDLLANARAEFKAQGYSQEQAQAAVDLYIKNMKAEADIYLQTRKEWVEEIKKDPDFGGDKFEQTARSAQLALRKFDADGQMVELLETSGFGDHPGVIKFLARIHKAIGEDDVHGNRDKIQGDKTPLHERLYGKDGMGPVNNPE